MKFWKFAFIMTIIGLLLGVYSRELMKYYNYDGLTYVTNLHVHALVLGMMIPLLFLVLDHQFPFQHNKGFKSFWILYKVGIIGLLIMNAIRGTLQVMQLDLSSALDASISGVAGMIHTTLAIGMIGLMILIRKGISSHQNKEQVL